MKFILKLLKIFAISVVVLLMIFCTVVIVFKDYFMMPSSLANRVMIHNEAPSNCESVLVHTETRDITLWKYKTDIIREDNQAKKIAVHFVGNGEVLPSHFSDYSSVYLLNSLGYTVYSANYKCVDDKNEKLNEDTIKLDAENIVKYISKSEQIDAKDILVSGYSIGTGTASYIANKFNAKILLLMAPYTSFKDIVKNKPVFKYFDNFVQIDFPSKNEIANLKDTCVVAAHGKKDNVIPYTHSENLKKLYKGNLKYYLYLHNTADHIDIIRKTKDQVEDAIIKCEEITRNL